MIHLCIMKIQPQNITPNNRTKDSLIEAAIQVLSAQPSATLADVAEAAGVKRVTLHRLIGTREELLKEIAFRSLTEMDEACHKAAEAAVSAVDKLQAIVGALVPLADRCHFLWQHPSAWKEESVAKEVSRHDQELRELIDQAKDEGDIPADLPNAWIIASLDAILFAALSAARAGDIAVNDAAKLAVRTLFEGIQVQSASRKRNHTKKTR